MSFRKYQKKAREVQALIDEKREREIEFPSIIRCLKAQEELGEVADVLIRYHFGTRKGRFSRKEAEKKMGEELVDVIALLLEIANNFEVDLDDVFTEKMEKTRERWEEL